MPRKKRVAVEESPATLEEQLESASIPDPVDSVAVRLTKLAPLIAAADAAGIDVPLALRNALPTLEEVVEDYRRQAEAANTADNEAKILKGHLLAHVDQRYLQTREVNNVIAGEGFELVRTPGCSAERIDPFKLIELGVDPDVIAAATDPGTPYHYFLIRKVKPAKEASA